MTLLNLNNPNIKQIILGSQSPRRSELLAGLGVQFSKMASDAEETYPEDTPSGQVAAFLAEKKALALQSNLSDGTLIITSDTTVVIGDQILGKPESKAEAIDMILSMQNGNHQVITGVCLLSKERKEVFSETTEVTFSKITRAEAAYYVEEFQPFDKAGAYGIQEWIGMAFIKSIKGSFYNVMGLPTHRVYDSLKNW